MIREILFQLQLHAPRRRHFVLLVLCAAIGAGANLYRVTDWLMHDYPRFEGFAPPPDGSSPADMRWVEEAVPVVRIPNTVWRPLAVTLRLCGAAGRAEAEGGPLTLAIDVNARSVVRVAVPERGGCAEPLLTLTDVPPGDVILTPRGASGASLRGLGLQVLSVRPVRLAWPTVQHAVEGAFCGALVWALLLMAVPGMVGPRRGAGREPAGRGTFDPGLVDAGIAGHGVGLPDIGGSQQEAAAAAAPDAAPPVDPAPPLAAPGWRRMLLVLIAVWTYLAMWAVLKPPMQSPDEVQYLVRAQSVLLQPWATGRSQIRVDPRFTNPFANRPPNELGRLFFRGENYLSRADVAVMKAIPWSDLHILGDGLNHTGMSTYPTLYYGAVFALAEGTRALWPLTPYQATFLYRGWSIVLAGLLWMLVYRVLRSMPEAAPHAGLLVTFLLLNPVLAFVSSSASVDAVTVPLGVLAILSMYTTAATGRGGWRAVAALVACGLTKPSAAPIAGGLGLAMILLSPRLAPRVRLLRLPPLPHVTAGLIAVARASLLLFVLFYAWSPLRFQGYQPHAADLWSHLRSLGPRKRFIWMTYWDALGWTDYYLPRAWDYILASIVALNLACAAATLRGHARRFALFCGLVLTGYVCSQIAGEYIHLETTGHNIIGRHFLPASIGVAALVTHRVRWARWLMVGTLVVMNVVLIDLTVQRYYAGDWGAVWLALP